MIRPTIARTLRDRLELIFLDEPTNHLDIDRLQELETALDAVTGRCAS